MKKKNNLNLNCYLNIFSNLNFTIGANRTMVFNSINSDYYFLPNELYDFIIKFNKQKISDILLEIQKNVLMEYMNFLIDYKIAYLSANQLEIININYMGNEFPNIVYNSIIYVSEGNFLHLKKNIIQLNTLGVHTIEYRFDNYNNCKKYFDFLFSPELDRIQNFEIVFSDYALDEVMKDMVIIYPRITKIILMNQEETLICNSNSESCKIYLVKSILKDLNLNCGCISPFYFSFNLEHFIESQKHNTCLNGKISIDYDGNIKNCPSLNYSYGNIKNKTIEDVLNIIDFKKVWNIKKDEIEICKDCEFRHVCTDCRAFTEVTNDKYSKPLKCGYNPYKNEWSEWSTNPLKQKAIAYYGMSDLIIKK